ncbi:hypothetical protein SPONL_2032 [uncultured Candidatus Thioglobus sp.]|nr:hypothetical protein SPONL_2032 [uncultured Candidatus Thioglobus sp.]
MSDRDLLAQILQPNAVIPLIKEYKDRFNVELVEPSVPGSKLTIRGCPSDCLVINVDDCFDNSRVFNGNSGVGKRADYILISEEKKKVLFIEMKKSSSGGGNIIKQLKGSLCFFEYCKKILEHFLSSKPCFGGYDLRFVSFKHTTIPKRKISANKSTKRHDTPETLLKISHTQFSEFAKLAA